MPAIISIVNQKGGTGKTTTTVNLSSALALLGKRVLVIDMDAQGNLGYSFGLEHEHTISHVLDGSMEMEEVIQECEGVHIVPSDMQLVDIELSLSDVQDRQAILHEKVNIISGNYDYIFFDCPPSLSILSLNALYASDYVIIPMLMEVLSLQGLDQIIHTIEKVNTAYAKKISVLGILPVMVDKRRKLSGEVKEHIQENYEINIFDSYIRNNVKASESPSFGESVVAYAPKSNSAKDYTAFAQEIVSLI